MKYKTFRSPTCPYNMPADITKQKFKIKGKGSACFNICID